MNKIREYRQQAGITQQHIATALGCDQSTVSKYECGERSPDLIQIKKLISVFYQHGIKTDVYDLFPCDPGETAA
jgi:transcriptional regulator with XRE-family HTH domain